MVRRLSNASRTLCVYRLEDLIAAFAQDNDEIDDEIDDDVFALDRRANIIIR